MIKSASRLTSKPEVASRLELTRRSSTKQKYLNKNNSKTSSFKINIVSSKKAPTKTTINANSSMSVKSNKQVSSLLSPLAAQSDIVVEGSLIKPKTRSLFLLVLVLLSLTWLSNSKICMCLNQQQPKQQQHAHSKAEALISPAAPGSIFSSLLGSNAGNSAAQQDLQQAQQTAADLHQSYKNGQTSDKVSLPGDILLGGLFPIHMKGTKVECGEINRDRGIQRLEAMLYALDRINEDSKLLPNIKLGAILLDSCSSSTYALNQSLEFIRASINTVESSAFECKDKSAPRPKYGSKMIAGVIGGSYSEVSLQVANLLRLFRIPQVSYASTGTALSDKTLYDLFARTVPSDMFQARAIADIVEKLNWSYVSLVSSEGLYGDSGSKEFMKQASARRICIATHEKISPTTDMNAYDSLVENLKKRNATGVVLFTRAEDTRELLLAVKRAKLFHNFAWVAADGWGTHQKLIEGVEDVAWGAITVELAAKAIPGFDQYMRGLTPWENVRNPWFSEYWQEWFDCQLQANLIQQQQVASGQALFNRRSSSGGSPLTPSSSSSWQDERSNKMKQTASENDNDNDNDNNNNDYELTSSDNGSSNDGSRKKRRTARTVLSNQTSRSTDMNHEDNLNAENPIKDRVSTTPSSSAPEQHDKNNNDEPKCINSGQMKKSSIKPKANRIQKREATQAAQLVSSGSGSLAHSSPSSLKQFCSPNLRISESNGYRQEQKVQFVVDAVYAMAHALHKAWYNLCDAQPGLVCEALKELNGGEFYAKYLLNVSFEDLAGSEVKFDERGDGLGRYNIYNFRQVRSARYLEHQQQQTAPPSSSGANQPAESSFWNNRHNSSGNALNGNHLSTTDTQGGSPDSNLDDPYKSGSNFNPQEGGEMMVDNINTREHSDIILDNNQPANDNLNDNINNNGQSIDKNLGASVSNMVEFEYSPIGRWTESDYNLKLDDIQFIQGDKSIPESYCSKPCEIGQAKIMRAGDHCCWICKTCAPFEFLPDEFNCLDCGIGRWPLPNKTSCFDLPQKVLRWDSIYSVISLSIACFGIALTAFVSIIFIKYLDTPVVKASGRELSFILLAGIAFCHLSTFVLLSKPTTFICTSQRFLVNFGFSLMYASLLVKTNRISRIFNCARKSAKRPSFISPRSQMIITAILVSIQVFLTFVWFVFEPPGTRADSPEGKRDEVILKCRVKGKSFIISLVYNMILITTCTVYAVKTRKIPENFNESKFIGFTMYTTIVIWLAFVTMFFGTNNSYEIQINTMCVCISLSAYVTLFCLFSPKLSIILLHPDKNVRKLTMNSATYKRPFKPVSSFASVDGRPGNNLTGGNGNEDGGAGTATGGTYTYGGAGAGGKTTTDGNSGGPMSTTSNVLNLGADSQGASRVQESSIISNAVYSNSSNSQKTPTTLSNQLTLVGTCVNCGAQQLTQVAPPISSAGMAAAGPSTNNSTTTITPQPGTLPAGSSGYSQQDNNNNNNCNPTSRHHYQQQSSHNHNQHQLLGSSSSSAALAAAASSSAPTTSTGGVSNNNIHDATKFNLTRCSAGGPIIGGGTTTTTTACNNGNNAARQHNQKSSSNANANANTNTNQQHHQPAGSISAVPSSAANLCRSSILVGSTNMQAGANNANRHIVTAAGVNGANRQQQQQQARPAGNSPSAAKVLHTRIQSNNDNLIIKKRLSTDDHIILESRLNGANSNTKQQQYSQQASWKANKQVGSLSRLNELTSISSSVGGGTGEHHHCPNESISSLVNDSILNTSQEDTPIGKLSHNNKYNKNNVTQKQRASLIGTNSVQELIHHHQHQHVGGVQKNDSFPSSDMNNINYNDTHNSAYLDCDDEEGGAEDDKGERTYVAGKGSDSMLWNQSVYSIDYCSDCCPSYCHCSCQACAASSQSNNDGDDVAMTAGGAGNLALTTTTNSSSAMQAANNAGGFCLHARGSHQEIDVDADDDEEDLEPDDYDILCDSLIIQDDSVVDTTTSTSTCLHNNNNNNNNNEDIEQQQTFSIRRRKSEEPTNEKGKSALFSIDGERAYFLTTTNKCSLGTLGADLNYQKVDKNNPTQTMEMRTMPPTTSSFGQHDASNRMNQNQKMYQTKRQSSANQEVDFNFPTSISASGLAGGNTIASTSSGGSSVKKLSSPETVVYAALQAAANSALSPIQTSQQYNLKFTSNRDKFSERNTTTSKSKNHPEQQQSSAKVDPTGNSGENKQQQPKVGTIQASIELVKSNSERNKRRAGSKKKDSKKKHHHHRGHRESGCLNYHDEYEYNYGLVQSQSDSESYCYDNDDENRRVRRPDDRDFDGDNDSRDNGCDDDDNDDDDYDYYDEDSSSLGPDDACNNNKDNYDDDFEHDGRVTLDKPLASKSCNAKSGTGGGGNKKRKNFSKPFKGHHNKQSSGGKKKSKELEADEHRINSVALIAATLSAGGLVVECGGGGSSCLNSSTSTGPQQQQQQHSDDPAKLSQTPEQVTGGQNFPGNATSSSALLLGNNNNNNNNNNKSSKQNK